MSFLPMKGFLFWTSPRKVSLILTLDLNSLCYGVRLWVIGDLGPMQFISNFTLLFAWNFIFSSTDHLSTLFMYWLVFQNQLDGNKCLLIIFISKSVSFIIASSVLNLLVLSIIIQKTVLEIKTLCEFNAMCCCLYYIGGSWDLPLCYFNKIHNWCLGVKS